MQVAWLFPGQGSQTVGMALDIAAEFPAAAELLKRADAALGVSLSRLIAEGPEDELMLTANAQPAILTASLMVLAALREALPSLKPVVAAGHSLGEYTALVAAEALSFEDAVKLVRLRGEAMQRAVPAGVGTMAALLACSPELAERACREAANGEAVSPANFNAPGQVVIAGSAAAVERACAIASEAGARPMPLKVSAPFHCALMQPAADVMQSALAAIHFATPQFPVLSNVDVLPHTDREGTLARLVAQVTSPVQWERTLLAMAERGVTHAIEVGPGNVLTGCVKRTIKQVKPLTVGTIEQLRTAAATLTQGPQDGG
jgi:[acyl-carrier-protein] S-malonyltransferase